MIAHAGHTEKRNIEEVLRLAKNIPSDQEVEVPNKAYQVWAAATSEILRTKPPLVLPGVKEDIIVGLLTGNSRLRAEAKLKAVKLDHLFKDKTMS